MGSHNTGTNSDYPQADLETKFDKACQDKPNQAGYPIFEVSYVYNDTTKTLRLTVEQIQVADSLTPEVFKTPVDVEITTKESSKTYRIFISERKQTFDFSVNSKPLMVIFDKGNWILKDLFFEKSKDELIYQALNVSEMIDRLWAVQELGRMVDKKDVVDVMMKLIKSGEFYAVRQEAINNLGKLKDESTARFLIDVFKNEQDSKVRRSIVEASGRGFDRNSRQKDNYQKT